MKAVKGNKVYTVDEVTAETYKFQGFDIYDDEGKLVAYGTGKTVSYEAYAELEKENAELEKENAELEKENAELRAKVESHNSQVKADTKKPVKKEGA